MKKNNGFLTRLIIILLLFWVLLSQYQICSKLNKIEKQLTISQKETQNQDQTKPSHDQDRNIHIH